MKGLAKFLVDKILGEAVNLESVLESKLDRSSHLDEMGLPGGAGVGLSLPGGYINGAPNPKDAKKLKSKLDGDGSEEYEKVEEKINSKTHKAHTDAEHNFLHHHKTSTYAPDYGHEAELDTIDFDDDREKEVGHQSDTKDTQNKGYEPVKENDLKGGKADGMTLKDIAKHHNVSIQDIKVEFMKGYAIEREHTSDINVAKEIALDHLYEHPKYYTRLAVVDENIIKESGSDAFPNDGNATTGKQWNSDWNDYDNQSYYLENLPNWKTVHKIPSEFEKKKAIDQKLPINSQSDNKTSKYNRILRTGIKSPNEFIKEGLLLEGGAAGHLAHPFEDADLKFSDMKEMIHRGLIGGLDKEAPVSEKLDGQNIAFSIKNGRVVFARNKGHVKNSAENALDSDGVAKMFAGRGNVEKAFTSAANDLQSAVSKLSPKEVKKMFGDGSKFMSLEIILPDTENVIPYGKSVLIFHNTIEYDKDGNEIGRSGEDATTLANSIQKVGASQQKTFGIEGPKVIAFSDADEKDYQKKSKEYQTKLSQVAKSYGLNDNSKLEDYRKKWWEKEIENQSKKAGIKLLNSEKAGLNKRWANGDKGFGVKNLSDERTKNWFREFESNQLVNSQKEMIKPIENIFLNVGANTIKRVTNFLASNNPEAAKKLKSETLKSIKAIRDSKDTDKIAKLQTELERLNSIGMDKIVPSEGLVFQYNGKPYKFTGAFAPVNQINGTFKFDRGPKKKEETKKPIAIFSGRFQPFHQGHYSIYKHLVDKFGKENVYIGTSNVTEPTKSPFNFNEKKSIITRMFSVPSNKVVQLKNPYAPEEILSKMPDDTQYVTAVSQKDAERLEKGGKYFKNFDKTNDKNRKGYKDEGYYIVAPEMQLSVNGKNISGTQLRATFGSDKLTPKQKLEIFKQVYPKFDKEIFQKIVSTTKKSEKAKAEKEKKGKVDEPKKTTKKTPIPVKQTKAVKKALDSKIKNPVTGRQIKVKSALRYDDKSPVKKAAINLLKIASK